MEVFSRLSPSQLVHFSGLHPVIQGKATDLSVIRERMETLSTIAVIKAGAKRNYQVLNPLDFLRERDALQWR